ncbi:hypothetical protein yfred0001_20210 [Yersinia frederiksenii ATCC 33641]|nr:hypothetical protein yfred0001_20210 [Yersinia frederiksenii ATCC 33641]
MPAGYHSFPSILALIYHFCEHRLNSFSCATKLGGCPM